MRVAPLALTGIMVCSGCIADVLRRPSPDVDHEASSRANSNPAKQPSQVEGMGSPAIQHRLIVREGRPYLELAADDRVVVSGNVDALHTQTKCDVEVSAESIPEGVLLRFTVRNSTESRAEMPVFQIPGIRMPRNDVLLVDNWKLVQFKQPRERNHHHLHALRSYPAEIYSPVLGLRDTSLFVGSSVMYNVLDERRELYLDYRYDPRQEAWIMEHQFWDERPRTVGESRRRVPAHLESGQTTSFSIAVTIAEASQWVHAFRPYRDFFRATYGTVRYEGSREPIHAISLGVLANVTPNNPKGYNRRPPGGQGRLDLVGWTGLYDQVMDDARTLGYRRVLMWQVAGVYQQHRHMNMVWEITSSWSPRMRETAREFVRLHQAGMTVGFWWGRAFSISGGFDSGRRHPWDPDSESDNAAAFREIDAAYAIGVRLIGLDATPRSIRPTDWSPSSDVVFRRILPKLHEHYPDMHWVIEPAACDFLHLWGSTFMWSGDVNGPPEFADYLVPGHESHVVMKRDRPHPGQAQRDAHMDSALLGQYIRWGYTPIVFSAAQFNLNVDRQLLAEDAQAQ